MPQVTSLRAVPLLRRAARSQRRAGRALLDVWMSHGDRVDALPPGFVAVGVTNNAPLAAMADESRRFYGVQFHPEVTHTLQALDGASFRLTDSGDGNTVPAQSLQRT